MLAFVPRPIVYLLAVLYLHPSMKSMMASEDCLMKLSNTEYLEKFLHDCVNQLTNCSIKSCNNYCRDLDFSQQEEDKARVLIQSVFKKSAFDEDHLPHFSSLSVQDNETIKECFKIRKEEIQEAEIKEKLLQGGVPLVENIDWKLKWVMGSSQLISISEPLLQVDLHCVKKNGVKSSVNFEINLEQLDNFIGVLEKVKAEL